MLTDGVTAFKTKWTHRLGLHVAHGGCRVSTDGEYPSLVARNRVLSSIVPENENSPRLSVTVGAPACDPSRTSMRAPGMALKAPSLTVPFIATMLAGSCGVVVTTAIAPGAVTGDVDPWQPASANSAITSPILVTFIVDAPVITRNEHMNCANNSL